MAASIGIEYCLWHDRGKPAELLSAVIGSADIDHLTIPAVTGPRAGWLFDPNDHPHAFQTEGGWHFAPDRDLYTASGVRPRTARWVGQRDTLQAVVDLAQRRELQLIFQLDLRAIPAILDQADALRVRDAFGRVPPNAPASILEPALRELTAAAIADLERFQPAGYQLLNWTLDMPGRLTAGAADDLLAIEFSASSRQLAAAAELDPDRVAAAVRELIGQRIAEEPNAVDADVSQADELVSQYLALRRTDATHWLDQLAKRYPQRRFWLAYDHHIDSGHWLDTELWSWSERFIEPAPSAEDLSFASDDHALAVPVWRPVMPAANALVRSVKEAFDARRRIDLVGLERAPTYTVNWLRQAVRFAKRNG